jgi:hypothetical protein
MQILTLLALSVGTANAEPMTEEEAAELSQAIDLPVQADNYRKSGADQDQALLALQSMEDAKVPASEAAMAVGTAAKDAEEIGPTNNFGNFVQAQLAEGKRGKDLSDAIHAEHEANGKGKGQGKGKGHGQGDGHGHAKGDGHVKGDGHGKGGGVSKDGKVKGDGHGKGGGVTKDGHVIGDGHGKGKGGGNGGGGVSKGGGNSEGGVSKGGGNTSGGVSKGGGQ